MMEAETSELGPTCKVERLRVAGAIAPSVRKGSARRVALVDASGVVTGYRNLSDVQKQILERAKIELDVDAPHKLEKAVCRACGRMFEVKKKNSSGRHCPGGCLTACVGCGKDARVYYKRVLAGSVRCKPCALKIVAAKRTPEQCARASATLRKTIAAMPREMFESMTRGLNRKPSQPRPKCSICGATMAGNTMAPSVVAKRGGKPPRCRKCSVETGTKVWDGSGRLDRASRAKRVADLVAEGMSFAEVAREMGCHEGTARKWARDA